MIVNQLGADMRDGALRRRGPLEWEDLMRSALSRWIRESLMRADDAQGLVEYALLLVLISIACIGILSALGSNISILYSAANVMTAP